jgi:hypothetical protein
MDILNFISWVKKGVRYVTTVPTDTGVLLPLAAKNAARDDDWLTLALNADGLKPLYNKGTVTQITSASTAVTLNTASGVITTVSQALLNGGKNTFTVNNSLVTASSVILVSAQYSNSSNGTPFVIVDTISAGSFSVTVTNPIATAMNATVKIHFFIVV